MQKLTIYSLLMLLTLSISLIYCEQATSPAYIPLGLSASGLAHNQVTISWTPAENADSYNVFRSTTEVGNYVLVAEAITTTEYTNTDLTAGTYYYYKVSAIVEDVESLMSSPLGILTFLDAPNGILIMSNDISYDTLTIMWNPQPTATGYVIYRSDALGTDGTLSSPVIAGRVNVENTNGSLLEFMDTNLSDGEIYYYSLAGINDSGESTQLSTPISVKTLYRDPSNNANITELTFSTTGIPTATQNGTLQGTNYSEEYFKFYYDGYTYIQAYLTDTNGDPLPDDTFEIELLDTTGENTASCYVSDNGNLTGVGWAYIGGPYDNVPRIYPSQDLIQNACNTQTGYYFIKVTRDGEFITGSTEFTLTVLKLQRDEYAYNGLDWYGSVFSIPSPQDPAFATPMYNDLESDLGITNYVNYIGLGSLPNYIDNGNVNNVGSIQQYSLGNTSVYQSALLNNQKSIYYYYTYINAGPPFRMYLDNSASSTGTAKMEILDSTLTAVTGLSITATAGNTTTSTFNLTNSGTYFIKISADTPGNYISADFGIETWVIDLGTISSGGTLSFNSSTSTPAYTFKPGFGEIWLAFRTPSTGMVDADPDRLDITLDKVDDTYTDLHAVLFRGSSNAISGGDFETNYVTDGGRIGYINCAGNGTDYYAYNTDNGNIAKTFTFAEDGATCPDLTDDTYYYIRIFADGGHNSYGNFTVTITHKNS